MYTHVCIYTCIHVYICTFIRVYIHAYIYSLKAEGVDVRGLHMCILEEVNKETHRTTHGKVAYIHVCVYIHKCIYMESDGGELWIYLQLY